MCPQRIHPRSREPRKSIADPKTASLYEPLPFVQVRAPLLPVEYYLHLADRNRCAVADDQHQPGVLPTLDPAIQDALAVASLGFSEALGKATSSSAATERLESPLRRYLIRMSTRPTPYGLFAGVALGEWGAATDLAIGEEAPLRRTRPDMGWLLRLVFDLEARPEIRRELCFVANPEILIRAGRVYLRDRAPNGDTGAADTMVSLRATGPVRRALEIARQPVSYEDLISQVEQAAPSATREKVERLIDTLWRHTVLLTDLRPPLTGGQPARYVFERLARIAPANDTVSRMREVLELAGKWDVQIGGPRTAAYTELVHFAQSFHGSPAAPAFQVDMALSLDGRTISRVVADEAAKAASLLLRLTPFPSGNPLLTRWRRAFGARYGEAREVPLLEMLDPNFGVTPEASGTDGPAQVNAGRRSSTLLEIACRALHDRQLSVTLDDDILADLQARTPDPARLPLSLDLNVVVAASSTQALDAGEFRIAIAPNIGAAAAGRHLGRFADLLDERSSEALKQLIEAESVHTEGIIRAELVWMPRTLRSANVAIRPASRHYEIVLGTMPGVDWSRTIPVGELLVGVRNECFYLRWGPGGPEVQPCSGHMLNPILGTAVSRFLAMLSLDGVAFLHGFDWGPAEGFPFLPQVKVGRIVLRPAEWRVAPGAGTLEIFKRPRAGLREWREQWSVPRHVYICTGDNRLLIDLEDAGQTDELEREIRRSRGRAVQLQEMFPTIDDMWLRGPAGHYAAEFVVSLVRTVNEKPSNLRASALTIPSTEAALSDGHTTTPSVTRLQGPGSNWLFVKLYCGRDLQDDLIAGPVRAFADDAMSAGHADNWFFIRYRDSDPHIRLRFKGSPNRLVERLFPELCRWAGRVVADGICSRFVLDTYDREVERYGGPSGIELAEELFASDSRAVSALLELLQSHRLDLERLVLGVVTVDDLLDSLGLSEEARLVWARQSVARHEAGPEYQRHKQLLRPLLANVGQRPSVLNEEAKKILASRRARLTQIGEQLAQLARQARLTRPLGDLWSSFVHMHCNRLFGTDGALTEQKVLGLFRRTREGLARAPEARLPTDGQQS